MPYPRSREGQRHMGNFLATNPLGTVVKVFLGAVLGALYLYLQNGNSFTDLDLTAVVGFVTAGLVVALPLLINVVNPADKRYGRTG